MTIARRQPFRSRLFARLYRRKHFFLAASINGAFWGAALAIPTLLYALMQSKDILASIGKLLGIALAATQICATVVYDMPTLRARRKAWEGRTQNRKG